MFVYVWKGYKTYTPLNLYFNAYELRRVYTQKENGSTILPAEVFKNHSSLTDELELEFLREGVQLTYALR